MDRVLELAVNYGADVIDLEPTDDEAIALAEVLDELRAEEDAHALAGRLRSAGYL